MSNKDIFYKNFSVLFDSKKLCEFIPLKEMNNNERINAMARFLFILTILLIGIKDDINYVYLFIFGCLFLIFIDINKKKKNLSEKKKINERFLSNESAIGCRRPTKNNPFMNPLLTDNYEDTQKSCNYTEEISKDIDNKFYKDLYLDTSNLFNKRNHQRQFYSVPGSTIPNDQTSFANWCYKTKKSCKEGNGEQCFDNLPNDPFFQNLVHT